MIKRNLNCVLASTILATGIFLNVSAEARSFSREQALPSVEINFEAIQKLKDSEKLAKKQHKENKSARSDIAKDKAVDRRVEAAPVKKIKTPKKLAEKKIVLPKVLKPEVADEAKVDAVIANGIVPSLRESEQSEAFAGANINIEKKEAEQKPEVIAVPEIKEEKIEQVAVAKMPAELPVNPKIEPEPPVVLPDSEINTQKETPSEEQKTGEVEDGAFSSIAKKASGFASSLKGIFKKDAANENTAVVQDDIIVGDKSHNLKVTQEDVKSLPSTLPVTDAATNSVANTSADKKETEFNVTDEDKVDISNASKADIKPETDRPLYYGKDVKIVLPNEIDKNDSLVIPKPETKPEENTDIAEQDDNAPIDLEPQQIEDKIAEAVPQTKEEEFEVVPEDNEKVAESPVKSDTAEPAIPQPAEVVAIQSDSLKNDIKPIDEANWQKVLDQAKEKAFAKHGESTEKQGEVVESKAEAEDKTKTDIVQPQEIEQPAKVAVNDLPAIKEEPTEQEEKKSLISSVLSWMPSFSSKTEEKPVQQEAEPQNKEPENLEIADSNIEAGAASGISQPLLRKAPQAVIDNLLKRAGAAPEPNAGTVENMEAAAEETPEAVNIAANDDNSADTLPATLPAETIAVSNKNAEEAAKVVQPLENMPDQNPVETAKLEAMPVQEEAKTEPEPIKPVETAEHKAEPVKPEAIQAENDKTKVVELASLPQVEEIEMPKKPALNLVDSGFLLSIDYSNADVDVPEFDKNRLAELVQQILPTNKRIKIISRAAGVEGQVNSARRISLQRAIAVRAQMIEAGLPSDRINVQAVGSNDSGNAALANSVSLEVLDDGASG